MDTGLIGKFKERAPRFVANFSQAHSIIFSEIIRVECAFVHTPPRLVFAALSHHLVSSQFSSWKHISLHTKDDYVDMYGLLAGSSVVST